MKREHFIVHKNWSDLGMALEDTADGRPKGPFLSFDSCINLALKIICVIITLDLG